MNRNKRKRGRKRSWRNQHDITTVDSPQIKLSPDRTDEAEGINSPRLSFEDLCKLADNINTNKESK